MMPPLLLAIVAGGVLLVLDRLTKAVVASRLPAAAERRIAPGVRIQHVRHRLRHAIVDRQRLSLPLLLGIVCVTLGLLLGLSSLFQAPAASAGIGAALAGAASNLWDRLRHRVFVDFVSIGRWPAFNLADAGVCVGAALALWNVA
ncbi:MAG: signal peptidase II [Gemmatimonadaceae bacterium]